MNTKNKLAVLRAVKYNILKDVGLCKNFSDVCFFLNYINKSKKFIYMAYDIAPIFNGDTKEIYWWDITNRSDRRFTVNHMIQYTKYKYRIILTLILTILFVYPYCKLRYKTVGLCYSLYRCSTYIFPKEIEYSFEAELRYFSKRNGGKLNSAYYWNIKRFFIRIKVLLDMLWFNIKLLKY